VRRDGAALARVRRLVEGARSLADPASALGRRARAELAVSTRLSPEGVELALSECLETRPSEADLEQLVASVAPRAAAYVALPSNVCIAPLRAIALALAESSAVRVRPSRREPVFTKLLAEAAPGHFEVVPELTPSARDSLWAYGGDASLSALAERLPRGAVLHAQGPGFGVAVVEAPLATRSAARDLAADIAPFDQRGCLSPRLLLFLGTAAEARVFAALLAEELEAVAERIPRGRLEPDEAAEIALFRDTFAYAGELLAAGPGFVALSPDERLEPAPVGRNLLISPALDREAALSALRSEVTAIGVAARESLHGTIAQLLPRARRCALGTMQRPPLDGPADRRNVQ
jgi:hypothetical protein